MICTPPPKVIALLDAEPVLIRTLTLLALTKLVGAKALIPLAPKYAAPVPVRLPLH